jgi:hypothetical protein
MMASTYSVYSLARAIAVFFVAFAVVVNADPTALDVVRSSVLDETTSRDDDYFQLLVCHARRGVVSKLACCLGSSLLEGKQP